MGVILGLWKYFLGRRERSEDAGPMPLDISPLTPAPQKEEEEEVQKEEEEEVILPTPRAQLPISSFPTSRVQVEGRSGDKPSKKTGPTHRKLWLSELVRIDRQLRREYTGGETPTVNDTEETPAGLTFSPSVHSTPITLGLFSGLPISKLHATCETCKCMITAYEQINFNMPRIHAECWSCECDKLFAFASKSQVFNRPDFVWNADKIGSLAQIRTGNLFN
jgi:hypothetical protein